MKTEKNHRDTETQRDKMPARSDRLAKVVVLAQTRGDCRSHEEGVRIRKYPSLDADRRRPSMQRFSLCLCVSVVLSGLLLGAVRAAGKLDSSITAVIDAPEYRHARWGLLVAELESGRVVYERSADQLFAPASNTKLYSVAAALDGLGAEHRFVTPVVRRGDVDGQGRLDGDLILVASGDPTLGGRSGSDGRFVFKNVDHTYANGFAGAELSEPDPLAGLNDLAQQVAAAGIRRVEGDVQVDDRLWARAFGTGSGPARLTPIMVNDNVVDVVVTPTTSGTPARVTWRPVTAAVQVDARVETLAADTGSAVTVTAPSPGRLVVRGRVAAGQRPLVRIAEVEDAAAFARALFIEALGRAGIAVRASALEPNRPEALPTREAVAALPRLAQHTSAPFSENARLILKVSHNLHAGVLPLLLAARKGQRTLAEGLRLQREFLARAGVEADAISFGSGAGGSPADLTSPRATVQLLRHMAGRKDFAVYEAALPRLGVDGSLWDAVPPDSPARGKVLAKSGTFSLFDTLNGKPMLTSKALSGYLTTAAGKRLAISLMVNNVRMEQFSDSARHGRTLGRLCEALYASE